MKTLRRWLAFAFRHDFQPMKDQPDLVVVMCCACGEVTTWKFGDRKQFSELFNRRGCPGK